MFTSFLLTRPTRTALLAARVGHRKSGCAVALASDLVRRKPHNFMPGDARWRNRRSAGKAPPYFQINLSLIRKTRYVKEQREHGLECGCHVSQGCRIQHFVHMYHFLLTSNPHRHELCLGSGTRVELDWQVHNLEKHDTRK